MIAQLGQSMYENKLRIWKTFSIRSLQFGVLFIAIVLTFFLYFDRLRRMEFEHTKGTLHDNTVWSDTVRNFTATDKFWQRITGSRPHLYAVTIDGDDANSAVQFEALQHLLGTKVALNLANLSNVDVASLDSYRWRNISELYFDSCSSDVVTRILDACPEATRVTLYECREVDDEALSFLTKLRRLEIVEIDGSNATGKFLELLKQPIKSIKLTNSRLDVERCVKALGMMRELEELTIQGSGEMVSLRCLFRIPKLCVLTVLDLEVPSDEDEQVRRLVKRRQMGLMGTQRYRRWFDSPRRED